MDIVTKTFRAPNMLEALKQVQRELGSDAIVVSMRKVPGGPAWQVWRSPIIEVIAMKNPGPGTNKKAVAKQVAAAIAKQAVAQPQPATSQPQAKPQPQAQAQQQEIQTVRETNNSSLIREDAFQITEQPPTPRPAASPKPNTSPAARVVSAYQPAIQANKLQRTAAPALPATTLPSEPDEPNDMAVSATIRIMTQAKNKPTEQREWRPFVPPQVSVRREELLSQTLAVTQPVDIPAIPQIESRSRTSPPQLPASLPIEEPKSEQRNLLTTLSLPNALKKTRDQLIEQGLHEELIVQLISTCLDILPPKALDDRARVRNLVQRQLEAEIRTIKSEDGYSPRVLFLVGSSGAGKTSSCAKLAAYAAHTHGKKVAWICADTVQTGAIAQARTFTELLNIPLYLAYTPEEMEEHIQQETKADWILVDTADCNPRNEASVVDLGNFITQIPTRATYLVASASTKQIDLNQAIASYKPFRIKGMIITKMDETLTYGNVFNIAWRSQVPIAFFTNGHQIFNNLHPATSQKLIDSLLGEGFAQ